VFLYQVMTGQSADGDDGQGVDPFNKPIVNAGALRLVMALLPSADALLLNKIAKDLNLLVARKEDNAVFFTQVRCCFSWDGEAERAVLDTHVSLKHRSRAIEG
jgi:hypothetical protein